MPSLPQPPGAPFKATIDPRIIPKASQPMGRPAKPNAPQPIEPGQEQQPLTYSEFVAAGGVPGSSNIIDQETLRYFDYRADFFGRTGGDVSPPRSSFISRNVDEGLIMGFAGSMKRWSALAGKAGLSDQVDEQGFYDIVGQRNIPFAPMTRSEAVWASIEYDSQMAYDALQKTGNGNMAGMMIGALPGGVFDPVNIGVSLITGGAAMVLRPAAATLRVADLISNKGYKTAEIALAFGDHSRTMAGHLGRATLETLAAVPLETHVREKYGEDYGVADLALDLAATGAITAAGKKIGDVREAAKQRATDARLKAIRDAALRQYRDEMAIEAEMSGDERFIAATQGASFYGSGEIPEIKVADIEAGRQASADLSTRTMDSGPTKTPEPHGELPYEVWQRITDSYKAGTVEKGKTRGFKSSEHNPEIFQSMYNIGRFGSRNEAKRLIKLFRQLGVLEQHHTVGLAESMIVEFKRFADSIDAHYKTDDAINADTISFVDSPFRYFDEALERRKVASTEVSFNGPVAPVAKSVIKNVEAIVQPVAEKAQLALGENVAKLAEARAKAETKAAEAKAKEPKAETPSAKKQSTAALPMAKVEKLPPIKLAKGENPGTVGNRAIAYDNKGAMYNLVFKVAEAGEVNVSHKLDMSGLNKKYPAEKQNRKRDRMASKDQINYYTQFLQAWRLLYDSRDVQNNIPILDKSKDALAGNGRLIALLRNVFGILGGERAVYEDYKAKLIEAAPGLGLDPEAIRAMENPILYRELLDDVDIAKFVEESNESTTAKRSEIETAGSLEAKIGDDSIATIEPGTRSGSFSDAINRIGSAILAKLSRTETATLMDADGFISQTGTRLVKAFLFGKTFVGEAASKVLKNFYEEEKVDLKEVGKALDEAMPALARLEALIRLGQVKEEYKIAGDLTVAAGKLLDLREAGLSVHDFLKQGGLFGNETGLTTKQITLLDLLDKGRKSTRRLADVLHNYATRAAGTRQANMEAPVSATEMLKQELQRQAEDGSAKFKDVASEAAAKLEELQKLAAETDNAADLSDLLKRSHDMVENIKESVKVCRHGK